MTAGDLITADGQLEWRGALLGSATPFRLTKLEGWLDLTEMRGDDYDRPSRHGMYPGASLMGKRVVTFSFLVKGVPLAQFQSMVDWMRALTAPVEQPVEQPLVIRLGGQSWMTMARCKGRTLNVDKYYALGYTTGAIRWEATDPRLYSPAEHVLTTPLASPATTGLKFPVQAPFDFGTGPTGGFLTATNTGSVASWPTLQIDGPVTGPVITNHATGERLAFDPTVPITAGQSLVLDTDQRAVTLNGGNASNLLLTRGWFPLLPGTATRLDFTASSYDPAALLTCRWRDAAA
ncbi:hypothetical protein GCM10010174_70190 [Kutzneria viridogrisea]|uniref:Siphovirus-type tail component C-terminal domain-containing protein n=1 Tax=Kutzneria viridogrisea TaxID=47990 RepID=A0ABR6BAU1_9PSEU|nr:hypothetical protein [Kutzneria viridogrisea]